jgi:isoleucyl-tRNA synthetase
MRLRLPNFLGDRPLSFYLAPPAPPPSARGKGPVRVPQGEPGTGITRPQAVGSVSEIDRWIISLQNSLIRDVRAAYEDYDVTLAGRLIQTFVCDHLSNWYVRLNRKRFWGGGLTPDKQAAYETLYSVLKTVALLSAPIAPFYSDELWRDLVPESECVHFERMPEADESLIDKDLEERMELAQKATSMVLALRRKVNIKVRQPLAKMLIPVISDSVRAQLEQVKNLILTEVNVKEAEFLAAVGRALGLETVDLSRQNPSPEALQKLTAAAVNQFTVLPFRLDGNALTIVASDPFDTAAADGAQLAASDGTEQLVTCNIDLAEIDRVRAATPSLQHRRPDCYGFAS